MSSQLFIRLTKGHIYVIERTVIEIGPNKCICHSP